MGKKGYKKGAEYFGYALVGPCPRVGVSIIHDGLMSGVVMARRYSDF